MTDILEVSAADYHSDNVADVPTLSASVAKLIVSQSPAHARYAHPRLNEAYERTADEKFDLGTACHSLLLEGRDSVEPIAMPNWQTNAAKEMRAEARAAGKIPMLLDQWASVQEMCQAVNRQLDEYEIQPRPFTTGKPEQTIVWDEGDVKCRARLDWLHDDLTAYDDLKTTSRVGGANPEAYARALYGVGGDVQAAFYRRGMLAVTGAEPEFRWAVIETVPPYALSVISPGPDVLALGDSKVKYALEVWKRCLDSGDWPGYPNAVCHAELPSYEDARWLEKTAREGVPV